MQQNAFTRLLRLWLLCVPFAVLFSSCTTGRYYRQNIMFRTPTGTGVDTMKLRALVGRTSRNYIIQPNDYLEVRVYTNKGERILDPNGELQFGGSSGVAGSTSGGGQPNAGGARAAGVRGGAQAGQASTAANQFLVQADGMVNLPMVNKVKITGYTLLQADSLLKTRYDVFYKDSYVSTRVNNNRIIVLGSPGGQVIPMYNDNMNLLEVLATVGGLDGGGLAGGGGGGGGGRGRAYNIRLIRGDLRNPQVQVIDLTTIEGMRRADLRVEPNDVVYIEPVRRPFFEALSDAGAVFSLIGGLAGLLTSYILVKDIISR